MYMKLVWVIKKAIGWKIDLQVEGLQNLPEKGPAVITFNHVDFLDAVVIVFALPRDLVGVVGHNYVKNPLVALFWLIGHAILVKRGKKDVKAMEKAKRVLARGGFLTIAPEGTRSRSGMLKQGKYGPAYLAANAECQIVPVAIIGTKDGLATIWKRFFSRGKLQVFVKIGRPFDIIVPAEIQPQKASRGVSARTNSKKGAQGKYPTPMTAAEKDIWQNVTNNQIMSRLAWMLPPEMRGQF